MNNSTEKIYIIIKSLMNRFIFTKILGDNIGVGIESYFAQKKELSGGEEIDYAELLVECLGNQVLENKAFVRFFIRQALTIEQLKGIANKLHLNTNVSSQRLKDSIESVTKSKLKKVLISELDLDNSFFEREKSLKTMTRETVTPFTPVPIEEDNAKDLIPKEFLGVHEYQKRIKDKLIKKIIFDSDAKVLVHMPTGSGKTKTSVEALIDFVKIKFTYPHDPGVILWFAHSKELCEQAYDTFKSLWKFKGDYPINFYKVFGDSEYEEIYKSMNDHAAIIFIGFQKFDTILNAKSSNFKLHAFRQFLIEKSKLVLIDEAHKALATTYKRALDFVTQTNGCRLVGLTATPGRSNYITGDTENRELAQFFGGNIIRITTPEDTILNNPLKFLQDINVLAQIESEELPVSIDFTKHGYIKSDYTQALKGGDVGKKELDIIATDPHRNGVILNKIKENIDGSTLVFACSKEHCIILSKLLQSEFQIESVVILGETDAKIRKDAIRNFKNGTLKVLINYGVLSTGFDAPRLNTLIVARPTKSVVLYSQIVGRALRGEANGGNKKNKLITIKDNLIGFPDPDFMFSYWEAFWN